MSVPTLPNTATSANVLEMKGVAATLQNYAASFTGLSADQVANLSRIYLELQNARRMAFSNIADSNNYFDTLIQDLAPISAAYNSYKIGALPWSSVQSALTTFGNNNAIIDNFNTFVNAFQHGWEIQDRVYFEYSKAGEAELNNQLGQLGDALDTISHAINIINKIDIALSIHPVNSVGTTLIENDSNLSNNFYASGSAGGAASLYIPLDSFTLDASTNVSNSTTFNLSGCTLAAGDQVIFSCTGNTNGTLINGNTYYVTGNGPSFGLSLTSGGTSTTVSGCTGTINLARQINAMQYTYNARQELAAIQSGFPAEGTVFSAIADVLTFLDNHSVNSSTWSGASSPDANTGNAWSNNFAGFWEDTTLRSKVNNLETELSSQNDVQKQNLRKALFLYQEFVKSAGTVMDRVYDIIKGIASRIGR